MGQAQSATIPSKEEILKRTKSGSDLVNELFQWMISQASIRDFYLMANPVHCKKYIMLTADVLNKVFYKIDVIPKEGPKGTIYFRKADVLNPQDKSDPLYKHREINCLRLAFLFVRIFQVFAALSLTILDVDPQLESKLLGDITRLRETENLPLFGPRQRGGSISGGALDAKKPLPISFEALRTSLSEIPLNPNYYKFSGTQIYIEYGAVGPDGSLPVKYDFSSTKNGRKERRSIEGRIAVERRGTDSIAIQLFNLRQRIGSDLKDIEDMTVNFSRLSIEDIFRDRGSRSIPEGLDHAFRKLAIGEREREDTKEVDYYDRYRNKGIDRKEKGSLSQFEKNIGAVAEGLHTQTIVSAFTRATPPKAHCISRALQLISDSGLQSQFPKEIYSHLCKTKFMVETRSLPPANERITKEAGIYALAQLFYDTLKESTPIISSATQEQYKAFLQKMKFVFEESKDSKLSLNTLKGNPLDTIVNKVPSSTCTKDTLDKTFKTSNRDTIRLLRDNVRKMITYQINHTANVTSLLRKLFLLPVESGKALQIHPRVLKNGMEEVNNIAEEARNLLIEYYSQCEILYRSGAEIIGDNKSVFTTI
jgi:hypothetical protein